MTTEEMYREFILDYYRNPKNKGQLKGHNASARDANVLCGDEIEMQLRIEDGAIKEIRYDGKGCIISQASAAMLTEIASGREPKDATAMKDEELLKELGIPLSATRMKCALLPMKVLRMALNGYVNKKTGKTVSERKTESRSADAKGKTGTRTR